MSGAPGGAGGRLSAHWLLLPESWPLANSDSNRSPFFFFLRVLRYPEVVLVSQKLARVGLPAPAMLMRGRWWWGL